MKQILIIILLFSSLVSKSQTNDKNIREIVLKKNQINKEYIFGKWNQNGETETHLTYLGKIKTKKGKIYKIMNSTWIWGQSSRATNRILIFNEKNQYIGNYYVTMVTDLPTKLENGILIFKNVDNDCDKNVESKVNLKNKLPKQFFRECKNGYGDIYVFDAEN